MATDPTNDFSITLARPVFNVVKAEFRYFFLENGIWNIDSTGNEFGLNLTLISTGVSTNGIITIPPGYYSQVALCNMIQTQCDDLVNGAITVVEINPSGNIIFESQLYTFTLVFVGNVLVQNNTAQILGFTAGSWSSSPSTTSQVVQGPNEVSISSYPYIYLQSSKLQNQLLTSSSLSAFAIVPMTSSLQGIGNTDVALGTTYDAGSYPLDASYFNQPVTLDRIDIRLVDDRGELLDTRNNDVTIVVRLAHTV